MGTGKIWTVGGMGGADLDVVTAESYDIVSPKVIVNKDGNPINGTLPDIGGLTQATSAYDDGNLGAICYRINKGAYRTSQSGGNYPVIHLPRTTVASAGSLNASKILSGQWAFGLWGTATSDANANASKILSGYSAYVDGSKINGSLTVQSVVSFNVAQYANLTLVASWARPSVGPWSGLRVICKQGGYPNNANDGTVFYDGSGIYATKTLSVGTWYFRAWNYITTNVGRMYGQYHDKAINNVTIQGQQTFTSSGIFYVPANVYSVNAFCVGGGGRGGDSEFNGGGGGGGGGYTKTFWNISVTPGQQIGVTIGAGGLQFVNNGSGGQTSFGSYVANGGFAGGGSGGPGGAGGSGGGGAGRHAEYYHMLIQGGGGGSNGANGENGVSEEDTNGGNGQGYTTKYFGDNNSALIYSGGGGGGAGHMGGGATRYYGGPGGAGGGGAGGNHNTNPNRGVNGAPNTGSGGGGAGSYTNSDDEWRYSVGGDGGSGICIVRWGY